MQMFAPLFTAQTSTDLLITLLFYLLLTLSCLGLGQVLARVLDLRTSDLDTCFGVIWLGWCGLLFLLQLVHFIFPLNVYTSIGIYGAALALFAWSCSARGARILGKDPVRIGKVVWLGIILFAPWVALQGMRFVLNWDSGLYHLSAIRWINEYAIVPGLGNLHDRLAFNISYFPFVASLNFYPVFNHGHNISLSWMLLLITMQCLSCFGRVAQDLWNKREPWAGDVPPALLLPYLLSVSCDELASPQVDSPCLVLRLMVFIYLWRTLAAKTKSEMSVFARILLILAVTAITLKLSNLVFACVACLVALLRCFIPESRSRWLLLNDLGPALVFSLVILLTWTAGGIVTSGYPLYPSTFLGLHTDWTLDPLSAKRTEEWVTSWARVPGGDPAIVLKGWNWVIPWCERMWTTRLVDFVLPMAIFVAGTLLAVTSVKDIIFSRNKAHPELYLGLLPVLGGVLFWFFFGPEPRFGVGLFWLLPLAVLCPYVMNLSSPAWRRSSILLLFAMMFLPLVLNPRGDALRFSGVGWVPLGTPMMEEKMTAQGLKIFVPKDGAMAWFGPLPNTPYFDPALQLRGVGLQSGFKTLPHREPQTGSLAPEVPALAFIGTNSSREGR